MKIPSAQKVYRGPTDCPYAAQLLYGASWKHLASGLIILGLNETANAQQYQGRRTCKSCCISPGISSNISAYKDQHCPCCPNLVAKDCEDDSHNNERDQHLDASHHEEHPPAQQGGKISDHLRSISQYCPRHIKSWYILIAYVGLHSQVY